MLFEKLDLESDEEVLRVVRKHWFVIVSELIGVFVFALTPIILLFIGIELPKFLGATVNFHASEYTPAFTFIISGWLLLSTLSAFVIWTHYYLDLWVITDRRIIAVEQIGFFNRNVGIFRLERLQDIEFSVKGLVQTFFNFGTLSAQTAGHNEANFKSAGMPNPDELQAIIQKAMDARLSELNNRPSIGTPLESAGE
jgi:hypothetical protein